jgi:hypothetical protein
MVRVSVSFIKSIKHIILSNKNIKHFYTKLYPNTKYSLDDILNDIFYVLKTGISWRELRSSVNWQSVYFHFQRFVEFNIFKLFYLQLRKNILPTLKQISKLLIPHL